ncbi:DNA ligase [Algibacillus agarilyticus]|uniref:DNA ligase n=1 Tax=Algibacillus agarilyticus TaxID=2234133 RepID=UPI000DD04FEB|nr:DNA ligase [Algibacillus agarilyticus]
MRTYTSFNLFVLFLGTMAFLVSSSLLAKSIQPAPVTLAKKYAKQNPIGHYLVSEKYDGVRAFWNGEYFTTRNGHKINVPSELIKSMPEVTLDGELWLGYNQFDQISGLVRRHKSTLIEWQFVQYRVFDAPDISGDFYQRYLKYKTIIEDINIPFLRVVEQKKLHDQTELYQWLDNVILLGGEGLMLRDIHADYHAGRHDSLLKLKRHDDAEAVVIGYIAAKGKYKGQVGSLLVKNAQGLTFKVGSGLTDENRLNPPAIGTVITYRYSGFTAKGLPRFPRFWRVRKKLCQSEHNECR